MLSASSPEYKVCGSAQAQGAQPFGGDYIYRKHTLIMKAITTVAQKYNLFFFLFMCFTSYFVFSIAVLPHSPGVVYYHLLLRRETRIPGVAPFSFQIEIWDLFVHRGQKSYTPTAFGKLWTTPGVRCMKHASS